MTKSFIAAVMLAALAVTGASAVPARADGEDIAKALIGIAIIAGIASAIDDDDDDRRQVYRHNNRYNNHNYRYNNQRGRLRNRLALPGECRHQFNTRRGLRTGFGRPCLSQRARHLDLPRRCERQGRIRGHWRTFYDEYCLRENGFRIGGRRNRN